MINVQKTTGAWECARKAARRGQTERRLSPAPAARPRGHRRTPISRVSGVKPGGKTEVSKNSSEKNHLEWNPLFLK